jgi:PAS domain S-box-containing protein
MDDLARPTRRTLTLQSASEFTQQLAPALGERTAESEVRRALNELRFDEQETRPYALRRLRGRLEANLSGLLGPVMSHSIIDRCIPFQPGGQAETEDIHLIERNLDRGNYQFTGIAADLDNLRRRHRETLDKLPIGICSIGGDGELLMWNQSMRSITGIPPEDVVGSLVDSMPAPWRTIIDDFLRGRKDSLLKTEITSESGDSRWISLHRTSADSGNDRVILVEDITEFELLEEELLHSERLASIGRLAAGVAHEIGNPVTGIACLAQNLEYETEPEELRYTAQDILRQTERVTRIVDSLADCVDEAIHLLSLNREAKPVEFINHCDRELVVLADSQRLLQVFINLLGNARDACDDYGQVSVAATLRGEQVSVTVEDNGCGIPPELQNQVFEPFFTTKDPGEGTGLGLALVFSIMDDMGGNVQITSPIRKPPQPGTRVTLQMTQASYGTTFEV